MKQRILLLLCCMTAATAQSQITKDNVAKLVQSAVDSVRIAGATILVAKGDQVIHHRGYGYAHLGFKVPAGVDTRYFIVGPGLAIMSAMTMQFVEQKKIRLEDSVLHYLPALPATYKDITIKHLITCTSGIPDYHYLGDRYQHAIGQPHHYDEVLARFSDLPLTSTPGSKYEWSISNFVIMCMILEEVSGRSYHELLAEFIKPLKISSTAGIDPRRNIERFATGYQYRLEGPDFFPSYQSLLNYDPGTRIYSTAADIFEIWKGMRNGTLIGKESFERMISREESKRNNSGPLGYGLILSTHEGKEMVQSAGGLPGYSNALRYIPSDDITIIVLCNTGVAQEANHIAGIIAGNVVKLPKFPIELPREVNYASIPVPKDSLNLLTGTFVLKRQMKGGGKVPGTVGMYQRTIRVFVEHNRLMVQESGQMPSPLLKQENGSYRVVSSLPQSSIRFVMDNGRLKGIVKEFDRQRAEDVGDRVGDGDARTFHSAINAASR